MRNLRLGSLNQMGELLLNYQRHGDWTKQFIHFRAESGMFLKSISIRPESIRVKLKRDCFILFHKDGFIYMVDSITFQDERDIAEMDTLSIDGKDVKCIKLMPWKTAPAFLDRLAKLFVNPDPLYTMAMYRVTPYITAKVKDGRSLIRREDGTPETMVRKRDVSLLVTGGLRIAEQSAKVVDDRRINARRKG